MRADELLNKVGDMPRPKKLEVGPRTKIVETDGRYALRHGKRTMVLEDQALGDLFQNIQWPTNLTRKVPSKLAAPVLNHLLQGTEALWAVGDNEKVTGILPAPKFYPVPMERAVRVVTRVATEAADFQAEVEASGRAVKLFAVGVDTLPVERHGHGRAVDNIRAGVHVQFSPFGTVQPMVQTYVMRLVCTNGALDEAVLRQWAGHGAGAGGEGDNIWQEFRRAIKDAYQSLDPVVAKYRQMVRETIPAGELGLLVQDLINQTRMSSEEQKMFNRLVQNNPPANMFDLYNHLTYMASHGGMAVKRRYKVLQHAALMASADQRNVVCPHCGHAGHVGGEGQVVEGQVIAVN